MSQWINHRKFVVRLVVVGLLLIVTVLAAAVDLFLLSATPSYDGERSVKIRPGTDVDRVTNVLQNAGILDKPTGFRWLAQLTGWGDQIKAGHYEIRSGTSNRDLLDILRRGLQTPVSVRIPDGASKDAVVSALAEPMAYGQKDVRQALADSSLARRLNTDTTHLWAYMLPDTYFFYWLTPADRVISKIKESFDEHLAETTDSTESVPLGLKPDEIIRLAGIVEWETGHVPEKRRIAGVYMNRLRDGWPLQADPTIQYALIQQEGGKRRLLFKDYEIDHPYNTYENPGLPPGPITNPTRTSVDAVVHPESHRYYYFVSRGDGSHIFSRTLSEHRRNANEYYRLMRERRRQEAEAAGS